MLYRKNRLSSGIVVLLLVLAVSATIIIRIFLSLYDTSKQNIIDIWSSRTEEASDQFSYYLKMPIDAVSFSAVAVNTMMRTGTTTEEVGAYFINETETYASVISDNTTGVYGYYKGEYLDGSGWIPPDDYEPLERPWYIDAVKADGDIAIVKPYLNLQTYTYMMSVSQLLDDKESVVSMDIFLDGVQSMIEDISAQKNIIEAFVVDDEGYVIAHSDISKVSKHLADDGSDADKLLFEKLMTSEDDHFEFETAKRRTIVFTEDVIDQWKTVVILDRVSVLKPLRIILIVSTILLVVVTISVLIVFANIMHKQIQNLELGREIEAIADIYTTVFRINIKKDTIKTLRFDNGNLKMFENRLKSFRTDAATMAGQISSLQSRDLLMQFMDPDTLEKRLNGIKSISQEFVDYNGKWMRIRFIVVERDEEEQLSKVLLALESIDEDKRRQEILKELSETDRMTGIRNRGSGESVIRSMLADGKAGMFCLMDADEFKSVNDNYGHSVGDKVLIAIADSMKKAFRDSDVVFRLGGDEFAVFSEGVVTQEIGERVIGRFFDCLDKVDIPELGDRKICISLGASFYPQSEIDSFEDLYARADAGTYESKRHKGCYATFK
jgi:diguanylate cyclase (GGDEF)-like protein